MAETLRSSLLVIKPNDQITREDARKEADSALETPVETQLTGHIRKAWVSAQSAKEEAERRMMKALRQRNGEYEADKLAEIRKFGGSEIYVRITDAKCRATAAWIRDILAMDRPWDLVPTPIASLSPQVQQRIQQEAFQEALFDAEQRIQLGDQVDFAQIQQVMQENMEGVEKQIREQLQAEAVLAANRMTLKIEDQLAEGGYSEALKTAIDIDLVTFGTAILKAPVIRSRQSIVWGDNGAPEVREEIIPEVERVSPLDLYPSDDASTIDDASFLIEKYRISRRVLASYKNVPGFNSEAIDKVLEEFGSGGLREWTTIDQERRDAALKDTDIEGETIDVLIYHGDAQGKMLQEWGMKDIDEELDEYAVESWLIGTHVVRTLINDHPLGKRPYCKAVLAQRGDSFWGSGIPELMADVDQQIQAVARSLTNNMAMASGPMVGVDAEKLVPGQSPDTIWPWKVWQFENAYTSSSSEPPIRFFQTSMKANELMTIYEKFVDMADQVTGVPSFISGDQNVGGAGNTASGLSMLMGAAARTVRIMVGNVDRGLIEPVINKFFEYNMLFTDDPTIKGDAKAIAKGASSLAVKEQATLRLIEFLQTTNNPTDVEIIGAGRRAEQLRSVGRMLDINPDNIAPTKEEISEQQELSQQQALEQQALAPTPPSPEQVGPDGNPVSGQDFRLFGQTGT